jgi:hypothetical protein
MVTIAFADAESTPHLTVHAEIRASQVEAPVYLDADGRAVTVQVCVCSYRCPTGIRLRATSVCAENHPPLL